MDIEIWKDINNYEGFYQCSNFGRIRSLDRVIESNSNTYIKKGQIIKPQLNKSSFYYQVGLNKNGKRKMCYVHHLIFSTFIDENYIHSKTNQINHKDGNKLNNHINNLEKSSPTDNLKHAYHVLNRTIVTKGAIKSSCTVYDKNDIKIGSYRSVNECSNNINLSPTQIRRLKETGKRSRQGLRITD